MASSRLENLALSLPARAGSKDIIKEKKDRRAEVLLQMRENPEKFLPTVQIGITIFGTLASALAGALSVTS